MSLGGGLLLVDHWHQHGDYRPTLIFTNQSPPPLSADNLVRGMHHDDNREKMEVCQENGWYARHQSLLTC